jgi:hypothetical protein
VPVGLLGPNAEGELLQPGRISDCYLGLLLRGGDPAEAPGVLFVSPAALLHPAVPQPDGTLVYELVTGHPDRTPHELVFLADLAVELRAWPHGTWTSLGVDPQAVASAVIGCWQDGHIKDLRCGGLTARRPWRWSGRRWPWRAHGLATGLPTRSARRTGSGGTQPADAGRAMTSGDRAVSRGGKRPSGQHGHLTAVPEAPPDTGHCRSGRFRSYLDTTR